MKKQIQLVLIIFGLIFMISYQVYEGIPLLKFMLLPVGVFMLAVGVLLIDTKSKKTDCFRYIGSGILALNGLAIFISNIIDLFK